MIKNVLLIITLLLFSVQISKAVEWEEVMSGIDYDQDFFDINYYGDTLMIYLDQFYYTTNLGKSWQPLKVIKYDKMIYSGYPFIQTSQTILFQGHDLDLIDKTGKISPIILDTNILYTDVHGYVDYSQYIYEFAKDDKYVYAFTHLKENAKGNYKEKSIVYRSSDYGYNWDRTNFEVEETGYHIIANNSCIFVAADKFYRSCDNGNNWEIINKRDPEYIFVSNSTILTNDVDSRNFAYSNDNGNNWQIKKLPNSNMACDALYGNNIFGTGFNSKLYSSICYFSGDMGDTWAIFEFIDERIIFESIFYKDYLFVVSRSKPSYPNVDNYRIHRISLAELKNIQGVDNTKLSSNNYVSPNPTTEFINVTEDLTINYTDFQIVDIYGRIVVSGKIETKQINVSHLPNGVYNIIYTSFDKKLIQKFIKI